MDFFQQQDDARRKTLWLVLCFLLAVAGIIASIYLVAIAAFGYTSHHAIAGQQSVRLWNPTLLGWISLGTLAVIAVGSAYKIAELAGGGETVALLLGGRLVDRQRADLAEKRLLNVVEEMALASGIPVPPVYILEEEKSINAFAAGHQPADAVIAVSRGCLDYLNRDELQGVIGHEFSHVLNGDMRLNLRLVGILHGILILAILGWYVMRFSGSSSSGSSSKRGSGAPVLLFGLGLLAVGYIGVFFGRLIKSGISRQREYLADASSVQFTRNPAGIAGALKKIGGVSQGSRIRNAHAEEVSHMFFGDAFAGSPLNLFATHPPLADRIARIDPSFDGKFPKVLPIEPTPDRAASEELSRKRRAFQEAIGAAGRGAAATLVPLDPATAMERIGAPTIEQVLFAGALLDDLPDPLRAAASEPYSARALVYAVLLDRGEAVRAKQLSALQTPPEEPTCRETMRLAGEVQGLREGFLLPLVDLALPALKRLSADQYAAFRGNVEALIAADAKVNLFEYAVRTLIFSNLDVHFGRARPPAPRYLAIAPLAGPIGTVLATLARAGQAPESAAQRAFDLGTAELGVKLAMPPAEACTLEALDEAIRALAQAYPPIKKRILRACAAAVAADGQVTVKEGELLRAVAATLGCPMSPILAGPVARGELGH